MPAFAESFPSDGLMLEDMVYEDAATQENIGVYDGTVTATAEYEDILYQIGAGTYLPAGSLDAEQCPANSYCPGVRYATYNENAAQGATSCPSDYPNSDAGAASEFHCYTACTLSTANTKHASSVSGNNYLFYQAKMTDGYDTCLATACNNGYHLAETIQIVEQEPLVDINYYEVPYGMHVWGLDDSDVAKYKDPDTGYTKEGWPEEPTESLMQFQEVAQALGRYYNSEPGTWSAAYSSGVLFGEASCQPTETSAVQDILSVVNERIWDRDIEPEWVREQLTPLVGAAKANYIADIADMEDMYQAVAKLEAAKDIVFSEIKDVPSGATNTVGDCYCRLAAYMPFSTFYQPRPMSLDSSGWGEQVFDEGRWVKVARYPNGGCERSCASECASFEYINTTDRGLLFGALEYQTVTGTCEGNEITINWTDATDEDIAANNAGMCTYGGDIRTPVAAMEKPGKKFKGWYIEVIPR